MTTIEMIFLGIAFVILVAPFAFYRFTQLQYPVPSYEAGYFTVLKLVLGILALPVYFGICAFSTGYFYLLSYPKSDVFGMNESQWADYMQGAAPEYFGILPVVGMLVFAFSLIVFGTIDTRRWEAKVWEDPGTITSKAIRAMSYFMHVYFPFLVLALAVALLLYFFQERFPRNLEAIPYWFRQAINQDVGDNEQPYLIGFAVIAGIALLVGLWALICMLRAILASFWMKTEATITRSELYTYVSGTGRSRSVNHRFLVDYTYLVDGIDYAGNSLSYSTQWIYHNKPYIWRQTKRYPVGGQVDVYVNPKKPEQSVLEAGIDWWGTLLIALHVALFFIGATVFLIPQIIR